ncbi:Protein timeless-like [Vitis vinifera]|uniref:Protein timeless-like n=1 Tax=Vitis vinifera TaxID=29760 RepID=A0A438ICT9_VITVI|nr:Protein timeless-like [Vitis vinifera]
MDMEGLSVICAGLGSIDEDDGGNRIGYAKTDYCLDNLKDLLRFLRRDDPQSRSVFKQVCKWNTVSKDLIPIIEHCQDDRNLVLNAVKVLVFLTMPIEASSNDISQQIEYLWGLKSSITRSNTIAVVMSLLESPLENLECWIWQAFSYCYGLKFLWNFFHFRYSVIIVLFMCFWFLTNPMPHSEAFTEDDWKLVQLVLTLFRNILAIQDISLQQKAGESASQFLSLRDRFLELLFNENVMDLILVITQNVGGSSKYFRQDNLLLLEIFHYIFMGQEPELLAKAHLNCSKVDGDTKTSLNGLKSIIEEEEEKRKLLRIRKLNRSSQFCGAFTRVTMDGSKTFFKGNPTFTSHDKFLKPQVPRGPLKKIVWDHGSLPSAKDNILELVHDFVNQFLSGGYNVLMQSICEDIEKEHHQIQNSDVVVFFQVSQFVTSFQYHKFLISKPNRGMDTSETFANEYADSTFFKGDICGPIAATMNEAMFLLVVLKWRNAFDGLKETNDYKFLSAAGSLMKNMIRMLDLVLKLSLEDSKEPQTARILLYKLFYDQTDQGMTHFLLNLIKSFDSHKQPKRDLDPTNFIILVSDLADLVEMIYIVVQLMENLQAHGTLRVRGLTFDSSSEILQSPLNQVSRKSRKGRKKRTLSDKNENEGEHGDHGVIQNEIGVSNCGQSVDLNMSQKESLENSISDGRQEAVIQIEPEIPVLGTGNLGGSLPHMDVQKAKNTTDDLHYGTDDSSGDEQAAVVDEVDFKVSTLVSAFANNHVIQNLCWLLKFYKSNSTTTNHYIICILRKICDDLELSPMLYQLSLLTIFYNILCEQKSCPCKDYENIVCFLTNLVRKMLRKMKSQPLLFVEVLFWKTRGECHYITSQSLLHELGSLKKESGKWGNISRHGEIGSTEGKGWMHRSIADALGEDEADVVISHEPVYQKNDDNFSEAEEGVTPISSSKIDGKTNSDNVGHYAEHESERVSKRKRRLVLSAEVEKNIKDLYEKFKDDRHCSRLIAEALDPDCKVSPVQVSNKLKQLGLKIAPKKRMLQVDVPLSDSTNQLMEEARAVGEESAHLVCSNNSEGSLVRKSLHTRKRVRAFSKDQEETIRALYEQFKGHKRCTYMIASALAGDDILTAAQVSRKLKQLGLHVPRRKRAEGNMHLRDEDLNDFDTAKHRILMMKHCCH